MRTPLTNIIGFTQLLADGGVGPLNPKQLEYAGYITNPRPRCSRSSTTFSTSPRSTPARWSFALEEVDVVEAMKAAAEGVQDRLSESKIELRIVATDDVGSLRADGRRVRQILFNLLSNAIGFSAPGQTVTLAAMRRGGEIVFKVSDRGRGIPAEVLDRVFDRFESHTSGSRHRGPGLGLSIVRALVELHGGRVHIDSALGEGTTVTCIFPIDGAPSLSERGRLKWKSQQEAAPAVSNRSNCPTRRRRSRWPNGWPVSRGAGTSSRFRGDLGAGKTTFARGFLRALLDDPQLEAPSPTFTLMQVYEAPEFPVVHADFYRLSPRRGARAARLGRSRRGRGHAGRMAGSRRRSAAARSARNRLRLRSRQRGGLSPRRRPRPRRARGPIRAGARDRGAAPARGLGRGAARLSCRATRRRAPTSA